MKRIHRKRPRKTRAFLLFELINNVDILAALTLHFALSPSGEKAKMRGAISYDAALAVSTSLVKLAGSEIARSARIFRSIATPFLVRPAMNLL